MTFKQILDRSIFILNVVKLYKEANVFSVVVLLHFSLFHFGLVVESEELLENTNLNVLLVH